MNSSDPTPGMPGGSEGFKTHLNAWEDNIPRQGSGTTSFIPYNPHRCYCRRCPHCGGIVDQYRWPETPYPTYPWIVYTQTPTYTGATSSFPVIANNDNTVGV